MAHEAQKGEGAKGSQRDSDVLVGMRNDVKGVASKLSKAGSRAGGFLVSNALGKLSKALNFKSKPTPPPRICQGRAQPQSEPVTRIVTRSSSPGRHTISCSPDDKQEFFEALERQIQCALWKNQHILLDRLIEARKAMQIDGTDLPAEDLRSALMAHLERAVGDRDVDFWRHKSVQSSGHSDEQPGTPDNQSEGVLSTLSTPVVYQISRRAAMPAPPVGFDTFAGCSPPDPKHFGALSTLCLDSPGGLAPHSRARPWMSRQPTATSSMANTPQATPRVESAGKNSPLSALEEKKEDRSTAKGFDQSLTTAAWLIVLLLVVVVVMCGFLVDASLRSHSLSRTLLVPVDRVELPRQRHHKATPHADVGAGECDGESLSGTCPTAEALSIPRPGGSAKERAVLGPPEPTLLQRTLAISPFGAETLSMSPMLERTVGLSPLWVWTTKIGTLGSD